MIFALHANMPAAVLRFASAAVRQPRLRLEYIDGLRAAAAIYVVLCHSWYTIWPRGTKETPLWMHWLNHGHFAVDMFIVLSGFCLMLPVVRGGGSLRGGSLLFFKNRARRILPPYFAAFALALLLDLALIGHKTGGFWDATLPFTWHSFFVHLLLLQNFSPAESPKINYVFWSISLEWWIYFLFPGLIWAWKRIGTGPTVLLSAIFSLLLCRACGHFFHDILSLHYIALFVLGMFGGEIVYSHQPVMQRLRDALPWRGMTWGALGLTALATLGKLPHLSSNTCLDLFVGGVTFCLLVTVSIKQTNLIGRALSQKAMVFLGSFAYSIYLVHAPLIQVLWQYVLHPLHLAPLPSFLLLELVGAPVIVACAYLFHLACERPFMSKPGTKIKTEEQAEIAAIVSPAP